MITIPKEDLCRLELQANAIRQDIIRMVHTARSGHPGGALGLADVFTVLYHYHARIRAEDPLWPDRDYVLLSNGHACPVWYAALASKGFFDANELMNFRKISSLLQGHPHMPDTPGVENSGGPLGQGTSQAVGIALGLRLQSKTSDVYCICSDGEHQEGQVWEAVQFAGRERLGNLVFFMDWNHIQIDGRTPDITNDERYYKQSYEAFGWRVFSIKNHDICLLKNTLENARNYRKGPVLILADTIPGKGVDFMENNHKWHGRAPNDAEKEDALRQLEAERKLIKQRYGL